MCNLKQDLYYKNYKLKINITISMQFGIKSKINKMTQRYRNYNILNLF